MNVAAAFLVVASATFVLVMCLYAIVKLLGWEAIIVGLALAIIVGSTAAAIEYITTERSE